MYVIVRDVGGHALCAYTKCGKTTFKVASPHGVLISIHFVKNSEFQLVETLAERICEIILGEFNVEQVKLTLNKGKAVTGAQGVGVVINRRKNG